MKCPFKVPQLFISFFFLLVGSWRSRQSDERVIELAANWRRDYWLQWISLNSVCSSLAQSAVSDLHRLVTPRTSKVMARWWTEFTLDLLCLLMEVFLARRLAGWQQTSLSLHLLSHSTGSSQWNVLSGDRWKLAFIFQLLYLEYKFSSIELKYWGHTWI